MQDVVELQFDWLFTISMGYYEIKQYWMIPDVVYNSRRDPCTFGSLKFTYTEVGVIKTTPQISC